MKVRITDGVWKGQEGDLARTEGAMSVVLMPGGRLVEFDSARVEPAIAEPDEPESE